MSKIESKSVVIPSKKSQRGAQSTIKPREKMPTIYRHGASHELKKDDLVWANDKSYFRRKLNEGKAQEKSTHLSRSRRTSEENPESMMSNSDFYRQDLIHTLRHEPQGKQVNFDVLNNPKKLMFGRNEDNYFSSMTKQNSSRSSNESPMRKTLTHLIRFQPEVTCKIGSINSRDFSIPRPQLKVGSNIFIDTYSPF